MKVKIKLNGGVMPKKQHEGDAAFDLYTPEDVLVYDNRQIIDMKFSIELPIGYAATIQPRSGFSAKGMEVETLDEDGNPTLIRMDADVCRGLIDSNYRGSVGVIIKVHDLPTDQKFTIKKGTRIAQMQIVPVPEVDLVPAEELSSTERDENGFGSTGSI